MLLEIKVELWMDNKPSLSFKGRGLFVGEGEWSFGRSVELEGLHGSERRRKKDQLK